MAKLKVLVTGAGLLGHAINQVKDEFPDYEVIFPHRRAFDLRSPRHAELMIGSYTPDVVVMNAARVGGIKMNREQPETMFHDNLLISANLIHAAVGKTAKVIGFGSGCSMPEIDEVTENNVMDGVPYDSNYGYGWAKKMTKIHLRAAREQFKLDSTYVVFNSLYGENDRFSSEDAHVVPSLISRTWKSHLNGEKLVLWGDGEAVREMTYSRDAARITLKSITKDLDCLLVGSGQNFSINQISSQICESLGVSPEIGHDLSKPSGQKKRPEFSRKVFVENFPGFEFTKFGDGLKNTCDWFLANQAV